MKIKWLKYNRWKYCLRKRRLKSRLPELSPRSRTDSPTADDDGFYSERFEISRLMPEKDRKQTELINVASQLIASRFKPDYHEIGAALKTKSGQIFSAVHLEATVGRIAVCAEAVAIGMAATAGDTEIETIVAVNRVGQVVSPCGMCRELIADYAPDAKVIVPGESGPTLVAISDLLPNKYHR